VKFDLFGEFSNDDDKLMNENENHQGFDEHFQCDAGSSTMINETDLKSNNDVDIVCSPLSFIAFPLRCVVTIEQHKTKTNNLAIFSSHTLFFRYSLHK
jgi:hypothetical protein